MGVLRNASVRNSIAKDSEQSPCAQATSDYPCWDMARNQLYPKRKENIIMTPMNDGTGPFGQGPIGKGMVPCGGGQGRGQGKGQCRRNGRGQGQGMRGQGRGFGNANFQQKEQPTVADANQPVQ